MFCNKCGILVEENSKFCTYCGNKVESTINSKENIQVENNINSKVNENYSDIDKKYNDEIIDPNTKVFSILGIVIPIISAIVWWNVELSVGFVLLLAGLGITFTNKGKINNKARATVGYIANFILIAMAGLMYVILE